MLEKSAAAAAARSTYRSLLRAAASLPEGPVRNKALANVRSLAREAASEAEAAEEEQATTARSIGDGDGDKRKISLSSAAAPATLLFRWVSGLPQVRWRRDLCL